MCSSDLKSYQIAALAEPPLPLALQEYQPRLPCNLRTIMKFAVASLVLSLAAPAAAFANGATSCAAGPTGTTQGSLAAGGMAVYFGNLNLETDIGMETPPGGQDYTPVGLCTGTLNLATGFNLCERCQGELFC